MILGSKIARERTIYSTKVSSVHFFIDYRGRLELQVLTESQSKQTTCSMNFYSVCAVQHHICPAAWITVLTFYCFGWQQQRKHSGSFQNRPSKRQRCWRFSHLLVKGWYKQVGKLENLVLHSWEPEFSRLRKSILPPPPVSLQLGQPPHLFIQGIPLI